MNIRETDGSSFIGTEVRKLFFGASMTKKKLFLAMEAIQMNGAVTGWLGYLSAFDPNEWDVDLFLFDPEMHDGLKAPSFVRLRPIDPYCVIARVGLKAAIQYALTSGRYGLAVKRIVYSLLQRHVKAFRKWNLMSRAARQPGHYDVAIGCTMGMTWRYVAEKVDAPVKLLWLDTDVRFGPWPAYWDNFKRYIDEASGLVCVSKSIRDKMRAANPHWAKKIFAMNYVIDEARIRRLARDPSGLPPKKAFRLVTVGRYSQQKGQSLIPKIAAELLRGGLDFEWHIIGPGCVAARAHVHDELVELGVADRIFHWDGMANPYAEMATADMYVQPSVFEGYGLTVSEAMVSGSYVVASDIAEFREQITSDAFGSFATVGDAKSFAKAILNSADFVRARSAKTRFETPYTAQKTYAQFCEIINTISAGI